MFLRKKNLKGRSDTHRFKVWCAAYGYGGDRSFVDKNTILMSAINGIVSEDDLRRRFPENVVLRTIAQKMDSVYSGNQMNHTQTGELVFGADDPSQHEAQEKVRELLNAVIFLCFI